MEKYEHGAFSQNQGGTVYDRNSKESLFISMLQPDNHVKGLKPWQKSPSALLLAYFDGI